MISAHWTTEPNNTFTVEIIFRWHQNILYPHLIEELWIILGYLWPNPYYQIDEEEILHAPSRLSLATGVTALEYPTCINTHSPSSSPEPLHKLELPVPISTENLPPLPGIDNYNRCVEILQQRIEAHNQSLHQLPITVEQRVDQLLAHIRSGVNLDKITFREGSITYWNLWNIDCNANPQFYTDSSNTADDNYEQPCLKDLEQEEEEEEVEESPQPIPGPLGTHSRIPESEHNSEEQSSENTSDRLERHLGTIIEETFQERTAPEFPPWVNQACEHVPGVPTAQPVWVDLVEWHKQEFNRVVEMRMKLLDSYFLVIFVIVLLHFLTYIRFLCTQ